MLTTLTAEQIEIRKTGIGGSEIAAVLGLDPYKTALDVWCSKKGISSFDDTSALRRGRLLEPVVAEIYAERTGIPHEPDLWRQMERVRRPALVEPRTTFRHPSCPLALATPDRVVVADGRMQRLVQIKTAGPRQAHRWGPDGSGVFPEAYYCQVVWELFVCPVEERRNDLVALVIGRDADLDDVRCYPVAYDERLAQEMYETAARFWRDHVVADRPPDLDHTESAREYLRARFPANRGRIARADSATDELAAEIRDARMDAKAATERLEALENRMKAAIGENDGIAGTWWKATWKAPQRGHVRWPEVAVALARKLGLADSALDEVANQHRSDPARRFLITFDED
jgi:putative phage-type endonuclease